MVKQYSPLRYPGGKSKLYPFLKDILSENSLLDGYYVEPFAGGCGAGLNLLLNEQVRKIVVNEKDPLLYSFWSSIVFDSDTTIKRLASFELTIESYYEQREILKRGGSVSDVGFAFLVVNRANRSGITNAGPIGGKNQNGKWKINARFNIEDLSKRISLISLYKNRIMLKNLDAIDFLSRLPEVVPICETLVYIDPPYYDKGKDLYDHYYNDEDHFRLSRFLKSENELRWIVSYDDHPFIRRIYSGFNERKFDFNYSAQKTSVGREVLFLSELIRVPPVYNQEVLSARKYRPGNLSVG